MVTRWDSGLVPDSWATAAAAVAAVVDVVVEPNDMNFGIERGRGGG